MKTYAPDYYGDFRCLCGDCRHTCCAGWEVPIDGESLARFEKMPDIAPFIDRDGDPHFRLTAEEKCPFLNEKGLCGMALRYGTDVFCQTCRDHPRFRNFWSDRIETGYGLVCEAACRLILGQPKPLTLVLFSDDGGENGLPDDEKWLLALREELLSSITETGPRARLLEYLIFRHLSDALYDGRVRERIAFIENAFREITASSDGSFDSLAEQARKWSFDVEYDEEELEKRLSSLTQT